MEENYIVISVSKLQVLMDSKHRVSELFGHTLQLQSFDRVEAHQNQTLKVTFIECENLQKSSQNSRQHNLRKSKEYVRSVTGIGDDHCTCVERYATHVLANIRANHLSIERESQAVLRFAEDGATVIISGQALCVAIAKAHIEHYKRSPLLTVQSDLQQALSGYESHDLSGNIAAAWTVESGEGSGSHFGVNKTNGGALVTKNPLQHTLSPGGESNHDSCYDSDNSPPNTGRNSVHIDGDVHSDVSRTTSDTLGRELDKDDDKRVINPSGQTQYVQYSSDRYLDELGSSSPSSYVSQPDPTVSGQGLKSQYVSKVEFALKLGYTENQIGAVLERLGTEVDQNELLSELIKQGSVDANLSVGTTASTNTRTGQKPEVIAIARRDSDRGERSGGNAPVVVRKAPLERKGSNGHAQSGRQVADVAGVGSVGAQQATQPFANLRPIVIDGSNVAMSHGNKEVFSCQGIKLAVDWFKARGHKEIRAFVPQWRTENPRIDNPIKDQELLYELEREQILVFTPARRVGGKRVICYDDRYILRTAVEDDAIVVSNDNYRDLLHEDPEFKKVIETRLLMYSFVHGAQGKTDRFMPPDDPLGRHGPKLDEFLSKGPTPAQIAAAAGGTGPRGENLPMVCPYAKKCTYGNKCKYYHPERGAVPLKSVTDNLKEQASKRLQEAKQKGLLTQTNSLGDGLRQSHKKPLGKTKSLSMGVPQKKALHRTPSGHPATAAANVDLHRVNSSPDQGSLLRAASPQNRAQRLLGGSAHSPNLLVTPPIGEGSERGYEVTGEVGNAGSAAMMAVASAGSRGLLATGGTGSNYSSPRRTPSPEQQQQHQQLQQSQQQHLHLPQQHGFPNVASGAGYTHEALRNVLSDPTSGYYSQAVAAAGVGGIGGGGVVQGPRGYSPQSVDDVNNMLRHQAAVSQQQQQFQQHRLAQGVPAVGDNSGPSGSMSIREFNMAASNAQGGEQKPTHKRLHRQLSLKGAEDPRLSTASSVGPTTKQGVPIVTFHGAQMPAVGDRRLGANNIPGLATWYQQAGVLTLEQYHLLSQQHGLQQAANPQAALGGLGATRQGEDNLHRNVLLKTQNAATGYAFHSEDMKLLQQQQQQTLYGGSEEATPTTPRASAGVHMPVGRMSSAPGAFGIGVSNSTKTSSSDSSRSSNTVQEKPGAVMKRQNSTSDSNLTSQAMKSLFGDSRWSFQGSSCIGSLDQSLEKQNTSLFQHSSTTNVSSSSGGLNLPGIKVAFGRDSNLFSESSASQKCRKNPQLSVNIQKSSSPTPQDFEVGRMTPGAPIKGPANRFLPQTTATDSAAAMGGGSLSRLDCSLFAAAQPQAGNNMAGALGLEESVLSCTAEALQQQQEELTRQQEVLEGKRLMVLQHQQLLHQKQQQLWRERELQLQAAAAAAMPPPPHPDAQREPFASSSGSINTTSGGEESGADMPLSRSDPRYQIYFHLCNLFDEGNVRRVMNSYPNETNPQVLCAHLITSIVPK